jgi:hypothetical protein
MLTEQSHACSLEWDTVFEQQTNYYRKAIALNCTGSNCNTRAKIFSTELSDSPLFVDSCDYLHRTLVLTDDCKRYLVKYCTKYMTNKDPHFHFIDAGVCTKFMASEPMVNLRNWDEECSWYLARMSTVREIPTVCQNYIILSCTQNTTCPCTVPEYKNETHFSIIDCPFNQCSSFNHHSFTPHELIVTAIMCFFMFWYWFKKTNKVL